MSSPFDQSSYQVRFEWGIAGLHRLAPADVVIVVDVLRFSSTVTDAVASGQSVALADAAGWSRNGAAVAAAAGEATVLIGSLRNASAVARAVLDLQNQREQRTSVSVIAAGELTDAGDLRFAVEDQLGAGSIIAALSDLGIDHTSPEAAAACESARGLRRAMRHLLTASGSGKELAAGVEATARIEASGLVPTSATAAAEVDATDAVPVLRDGSFVAFDASRGFSASLS
ncbi:phosphosulfolactate phosphohydrolase [Microbacterium sp. CH12i]|uniref:2-phosphosulfolactate phosphatase n=1 Tax=Microbacterium sp. CH12i TaxID=1479651 RepID=UPI0004615589|nr:2-phosphosulfolactate phosphatase [Microbacterium sp. CH12i]KDA04939.1 phosphosulfolactate phosphohydrolase [Microbacterium sp. CH12i]